MVKPWFIAAPPAGIDRHRGGFRQILHVLRSEHRSHLPVALHVALTALPNFASTPFP
jgi:hypothetical protein